jgi:hypothetical protein
MRNWTKIVNLRTKTLSFNGHAKTREFVIDSLLARRELPELGFPHTTLPLDLDQGALSILGGNFLI